EHRRESRARRDDAASGPHGGAGAPGLGVGRGAEDGQAHQGQGRQARRKHDYLPIHTASRPAVHVARGRKPPRRAESLPVSLPILCYGVKPRKKIGAWRPRKTAEEGGESGTGRFRPGEARAGAAGGWAGSPGGAPLSGLGVIVLVADI